MSEKVRYIAACGVPAMIIEGCNSLGLYMPVRMVEERSLPHLRPEGCLLSSEVFSSNLDLLLPYRKHILLLCNEQNHGSFHEHSPERIWLHADVETWLDAFNKLERNGSPYGTETSQAPLSQREKDVLRLIAAGLTAKEIADRLGISANTVVTHRKNLSSKLGIKSASGLSLYAMMNGLI